MPRPLPPAPAQAFENALVLVMATGGSTNAVLHFIAMARWGPALCVGRGQGGGGGQGFGEANAVRGLRVQRRQEPLQCCP